MVKLSLLVEFKDGHIHAPGVIPGLRVWFGWFKRPLPAAGYLVRLRLCRQCSGCLIAALVPIINHPSTSRFAANDIVITDDPKI